MKKFVRLFSMVLASLLVSSLLVSSAYAQEQLNMITYYPAPIGVYDRLRTVPRSALLDAECTGDTIGTIYTNQTDNLLYYCSTPGKWTVLLSPWEQDANNNLYPINALNPNLFIGIGTKDPTSLLHLESEGDVTIQIAADTDNNSSSENPRIQFSKKNDAITGGIGFVGNPGQIFTDSLQDTMYVENANFSALQLATDATARITILGNGKVGINRVDPQEQLHVEGNMKTSGDLYFQDFMRLHRIADSKLGFTSDNVNTASIHLLNSDDTFLGSFHGKIDGTDISSGLLDSDEKWAIEIVKNLHTEFSVNDRAYMRVAESVPGVGHLQLDLDGNGGNPMSDLKVTFETDGYYAVYAP